jgi:hypothetical protein
MRAFGAAVLTLLVAACSQPQAVPVTSPSTAATATPTTSAPLLLAVLEAKGTANVSTYNTVVIAGLDGYSRAAAAFTPMPVPAVGCMGALIPPSAHVAAGKVFFADGNGVVRSLSIDGTVATVATFPMTSKQQMLSFAVSPDGARILATIFTIPTNAFSCDGSPTTGSFTFDAYTATGGQSRSLVYHQSWSKAPSSVMALTGWDDVGPIGTFPTVWASQGGGPGSTLGVFVRIDAATVKPGAPFSDPSSCQVWDSVATGAFVCTKDSVIKNGGTPQQSVDVPVSIRRADGTELWHFTISGMNGPGSPYLSPDGTRVIMCCSDDSREWLIDRDGTESKLGAAFYGSGWLDTATVVGEYHPDPLQQPPLPLAYVGLSASGTVDSLGFSGLFVGTVRA